MIIGQGTVITLTATAAVTTSGAHIAHVQFYGSLNSGTAILLGQQDEGEVSGGDATYTFTWNGAAVGSWSVYAVATDTNGNASSNSNSEAFAVAVLPTAATPSISATNNSGSSLSSGGTSTGFATVTLGDSTSSPTIYYTTASGTTNSNTPAEYTSPRYNGPITLGPGTYTVNAIAYAPGCAVSSEATETFTIASPTGAVPTTAITSPASGTITQGGAAFAVDGTVTCTAATNWELDYAQGNASWTPFATGSLSSGGGSVSGSLDTTLMLNGQTQIRLLATTSGGQESIAYTTFTLKGDLKVGYFTLSYNDMTVPVAGMPIQITRTYDSRDKSSGAFGVGWTLSTSNVKLFKSVSQIGASWEQTESLLNYYVEPIGPANYVSVTMPNGDTYNFAAELDPYGQSFEPLESSTVVYMPIGETAGKATLVPVGDPSVLIPSGLNTPIQLLEGDGITTYDTDEFQMTMHNGSTLDIVKGQGLKWVSDTNGNTVYFNLTGTNPTISEQNVAGTTVRTVTIGLGGNGLITSITDPDGAINPDGHTVTYNNASGNLDSYTDQNGNTTNYVYDAAHDLLQINAPNGATPIENYYNSSGRLTSSVDANGKTISYSYTTGTVSGVTGSVGSETVTDRNDNSTMMVYDGNGNVIQTQNLGFVDSYGVAHGVKDANGSNGHIVTTSAVFGDPNNPNKPTSETDALSHVTTMSYTVAGDILTQSRAHTPAGGSAEQLVTAYTYDGNEHELTLQNPNNYGTSIFDEKKTYTLSGNVASSMDALGNTTNNAFNALGELVTVTNPNGGVASPE